MKIFAVLLFVLMLPTAGLTAEDKAKPVNIEQLMQDLRDLDSSTDMKGDHVVGEQMC